jgi:hypothetical protein
VAYSPWAGRSGQSKIKPRGLSDWLTAPPSTTSGSAVSIPPRGTGRIKVGNVAMTAHRVWELAHGALPPSNRVVA